MPRLHLGVLTTRNETWRFWLAVWSKPSIYFTNKILRELNNM